MKVGGDAFRHYPLIVNSGRFRPVLREELDRRTRDDIESLVFPYPHLKPTLTSWA